MGGGDVTEIRSSEKRTDWGKGSDEGLSPGPIEVPTSPR